MDKDGLPQTNEEYLAFYKKYLKDEEKKLRRYFKMVDAYTRRAESQKRDINRLVGRIQEYEDKIRQQKKPTS